MDKFIDFMAGLSALTIFVGILSATWILITVPVIIKIILTAFIILAVCSVAKKEIKEKR